MSPQETNQNSKPEPRFFYGYIVVAVSLVILLLTYGIRTSFGIFFKPMLTEFDWTRALTSGAVTLSMVTQGIWGIFMGRLNDKIGSRLVITLCCFLSGLGFLLISQVSASWHLYMFYGIIVGFGMGGVFVALLSTVAKWFVKKRGTMTGIVLVGIGGGTLFMSPVANWLISIYDWRSSCIILGSFVMVIGIILAQFLRRDPAQIGLVPYGQNTEDKKELASVPEGLSLSEAVYSRQFWMAGIIFFCLGYCIFAINIHIVPHITDLEISATTAANILATIGGVQTIGGIMMGSIADRIGNKRVLAIGFILILVAMLWLVPVTKVWMFYIFAIVYGLGVSGGGAMEPTIVAELFGIKSHGLILGVISFTFTIGGAVGPLVTGYIFDLTGSYQIAFLLCAALGFVGLILATMLRPIKMPNKPMSSPI
jgi:MFS family permease